jgi:hypothetical protein
MADENLKPEVTLEEKPVTPEVKPEVPVEKNPKEVRNELLREMSKEYGINLFDAEGLTKFKEYQESQKSEQERLQEQLKAYEEEKANWSKEKLEYQSKLKASELGISNDLLNDALKLAEGDPDKLPEVIKKYPIFKAKEGIKIGVQNPTDQKMPTDMSEVEAYMATDPRYRKYNKNKK